MFEKGWRKEEKQFFEIADRLFSNTPWPDGKYIAYSTIWGMYPRFLDDKTFQIPVSAKKRRAINLIIAHELLHFIFYPYFFKRYKEYKSHKYDFFVWNISEIFNSLILKRQEWKKLLKANNQDYPEHKKIISELSVKKYKLDNLIEAIISRVKKMNI